MTNFYTSDTHFGHPNIIKYTNRPFKDVRDMEDAMVSKWNAVVKPGDSVFHLGDFGFSASGEEITRILSRLNGQKFLICGNHDDGKVRKATGWSGVFDYRKVRDGEDRVMCFHYAMRVWDKSHHGSLHLYGHSHGTLPGTSQSTDVGVDCWDYTPVTLDQIKVRLATLPKFGQEDYHVRRLGNP